MKKTKQILAMILAVMLVAALAVSAFADEVNPGSITISNTIKDKTYELYRVFDLTYSEGTDPLKVSYTVSDAWASFFTGTGAKYLTDSATATVGDATVNLNPITVNGATKYINITNANVADFANDALAYAVAQKMTPVTTATGTGSAVTVSNLPLGYYLIYPVGASIPNDKYSGSICTLDSTLPSVTVNIKADIPEIDKNIRKQNGETIELTKLSTASVGDKVPYQVDTKVPDMTGYTKFYFVVNDTLTKGLTFNNDVVITLGTTTETTTATTLDPETAYSVSVTKDSSTGVTAVEIVFKNFIQYKALAGQPITITYSATVNESAQIIIPEENAVDLTFSNNPKTNPAGDPDDEDKPGDVVGKTPKIKTKTYVGGIKLIKVDGSDNTKKLVGAKFSISGTAQNVVLVNEEIYKKADSGTWYMLKDGTYTEAEPVTTTQGYNADKYDSLTQKYELVNVISQVVEDSTPFQASGYTNANGELIFKGLSAGTYTITELVAPDGYNLLTDPITVKLVLEPTGTKNELEARIVGYDKDNKPLNTNSSISNIAELVIENNSGVELPSTGGIGTTIFYVAGAILAVGAAIILFAKKRVNED